MTLDVPLDAVTNREGTILAGTPGKSPNSSAIRFTNSEAVLGELGDKIVIRDVLTLNANGVEGLLVNFVRTTTEQPTPLSTLAVYSIDMELKGRLTQGNAAFNAFMPASNEGSELTVEATEGNNISLSMTNVPIEGPYPCAECTSTARIKAKWSGVTLDLESYYIESNGRQFTYVKHADLQEIANAIAEGRDDFAGSYFAEGRVPELLDTRPGPPDVEDLPTRRVISFTDPIVEPCAQVYSRGGELYLDVEENSQARIVLPPNDWLGSETQVGDLYCPISTGYHEVRYPTAYFQVRPVGIGQFTIVDLVTPYS